MKGFAQRLRAVLVVSLLWCGGAAALDFTTEMNKLVVLADKLTPTAQQKIDIVTVAQGLLGMGGSLTTDQFSQIKSVLRYAIDMKVYGATVEGQLETVITSLDQAVGSAGTTTIAGTTATTATIAVPQTDVTVPFGTRVGLKLGELYRVSYQSFTEAMATAYLTGLEALLAEVAGATDSEITQFQGVLASIKNSTHFSSNNKNLSTAYIANALPRLDAVIAGVAPAAITDAKRIDFLERIYNPQDPIFQVSEQQDRFMRVLNLLAGRAGQLSQEARSRLVAVAQNAKLSSMTSRASAIDAMLQYIEAGSSAVAGTTTELPTAGTHVALMSLGAVGGDTGKQKYLRVEQRTTLSTAGVITVVPGSAYYLRCTSEDPLDPASQFEVAIQDGRVIFKPLLTTISRGAVLESPSMGQADAGKILCSVKDYTLPSATTVRFFMYGAMAKASFMNEATQGYLSVRSSQDVLTIDPTMLSPFKVTRDSAGISQEEFQVVTLSDVWVDFGNARNQDPTAAVTTLIEALGKLQTDGDRSMYVGELERFVARVRATNESWTAYQKLTTTVTAFTGLLDYLAYIQPFALLRSRIAAMQADLKKGASAGELPIAQLAAEDQLPAAGTRVALYSLWTEKDGSSPLKKYVAVVKDADGQWLATGSADNFLDPAAQFEVARDGNRIGFKSVGTSLTPPGLMLLLRTAAAGQQRAGQARFINSTMTGAEERFVMVGTTDKASFMNEATKGFLSVRRDHTVMTLDPDTFQPAGTLLSGVLTPYSWEQFTIVALTEVYKKLGLARNESNVATRAAAYTALIPQAKTVDERVALIKEVRYFINSYRTSRAAWTGFIADPSVVGAVSGLLSSLFGDPDYAPYNGYVKEMMDTLAVSETRELALSPRGGSYVWMVEDAFALNNASTVNVSFELLGSTNAQVALTDAAALTGEQLPMYELMFSSGSNSCQILRRGVEVQRFTYGGTLTPTRYSPTWVSYDNGTIRAGVGASVGLNVMVTWKDTNPLVAVGFIGFGSGNAAAWFRNISLGGVTTASGTTTTGLTTGTTTTAVTGESVAQAITRLDDWLSRLISPDGTYLQDLESVINRRVEATDTDIENLTSLIMSTQYNRNFIDNSAAQEKLNTLLTKLQAEITVPDRIVFGWNVKTWPVAITADQREAFLRNIQILIDQRGTLTAAQIAEIKNILNVAQYNQFSKEKSTITDLITTLTSPVTATSGLSGIDTLLAKMKTVVDATSTTADLRTLFVSTAGTLTAQLSTVSAAQRSTLKSYIQMAKDKITTFTTSERASLDGFLATITTAEATGTGIAGESVEQGIARLTDWLGRLTTADSSFLIDLDALMKRRIEASATELENLTTLLMSAQYNKNFISDAASQEKLTAMADYLKSEITIADRIAFGWKIKEWQTTLATFQHDAFLRNMQALVDLRGTLSEAQTAEITNILNVAQFNQFSKEKAAITTLISTLQSAPTAVVSAESIDTLLAKMKTVVDATSTTVESRALFVSTAGVLTGQLASLSTTQRSLLKSYIQTAKDKWSAAFTANEIGLLNGYLAAIIGVEATSADAATTTPIATTVGRVTRATRTDSGAATTGVIEPGVARITREQYEGARGLRR